MGGAGASAFDRSKMNPRGKPSGGDGGHGGSVLIRADPAYASLNHLGNLLIAANGRPGGSNNRCGSNGRDLHVSVPPGTRITRIYEEEAECQEEIDGEWVNAKISESNNHKLIEQSFVAEEDSVLLLKGGTGGRGNLRMGLNNHQSEKGQAGEEALFELDMARMADIGLIGFPNAGKSSLLRAISNAKPAVAPYPFTTLTPQIGVVSGERAFSVADIPGLIQGAHRDVGLGHRFLKHVSKSTALVCVLDLSRDDPVKDLCILEDELFRYDRNLCSKVKLVVGNKMDLLSQEMLSHRMSLILDEIGPRKRLIVVSARNHSNMDLLVEALSAIL